VKQILVSLFAGFLFGIGLALSKMIDPDKVLNFLDVTGHWDPSLALVMAGALSVSVLAFHIIPQRDAPLFDNTFRLPTRTDIDKPLLIGAALFGIGWGMAGYCPGPAVANLGLGGMNILIFVFSMIIGMITHRYVSKILRNVDEIT
jgi:uncharacterized membrane protein YedE/YeeE